MKTIKAVGYLMVAGAVILFVFSLIAPREEMGHSDRETAKTCATTSEIERYSAKNYFKTFTCAETVGTKLFCERFVFQDGKCIADYYYFRSIEN